MEQEKITVAIDGYSSCGKSTLAYQLAGCLGYIYVDSGAMYRAMTLFFLRNDLDYHSDQDIEYAIKHIKIHFEKRGSETHTFLNGKDVEKEIRTSTVSDHVSQVARISSVRSFLVKQQKKMGAEGGIVMDGRDIGTVVFPDADIKFFITADTEIRTDRRYRELLERGYEDISRQDVADNLRKRDHIDSTRQDSPLKKAEDAITVDNSDMNIPQQLKHTLEIIQNKYSFIESGC